MIIQYCSDLHLEFKQNSDYIKANPLKPSGDILMLAGDIVPFNMITKHEGFFDYVSNNFDVTYWIPGNHEYYGFDAAKKSGNLHEKIRSNVFLVNNFVEELDGVKFIFSTLWTIISPDNEWYIEHNLSDFRAIRYNDYRFSSKVYTQLHENCLSFIEEQLVLYHEGKTVVVTHHVPTFMNYPEQYKGDVLNEAFAIELFPLIEKSNIDCWIYGHHHSNIPEFSIGKTRMLTNQLGYVQLGENTKFDNAGIITM